MSDVPDTEHEDQEHSHKTLHLHDGIGHVIHRHKPGQSIGEFLESLNFTFTDNCLQTDENKRYCTNENEKWQMIINKKLVPMNTQYVFADEDQILLSYGARETEIQKQWNAITNDSCLYSKTCPERGDPPAENCLADPAIPCVAPLDDHSDY